MDFSVFCREIYSLVSARLPLHLQVETDLRTILHQGGWYYPSSRDRNAYFFDCAGAYKHYVSGMELSLLADALEYAFFCRRWDAGLPLPDTLSKTASPRQWSLRIRPMEEVPLLPDSAYYLCWDRYILEACLRQDPALSYRCILPEDVAENVREESLFWEFFWNKLIRQDPPLIYAQMPSQGLRELKLHSPRSWPVRDSASLTYILTSRKIRHGASVIFYPRVLSRIHHILSDYYLLLTSPHEIRLFPGNSAYLRDSLQSMPEEKPPAFENRDTPFPAALYQYTVERGLTSC
ncbi:MAG: hypothetical protein IJR95_07670 [Lachnospiraceae bacterium]|nr:hypothetical protein [Lachnospiraceae bacterium]